MKKIKPNELAAARQAEKESRLEPPKLELLENLNREGMVKLMAETGVTIPAKEFALWKPTKRNLGQVRGVYGNVMILAHDGMLGLFQRAEGEVGARYVTAHIGWFDGTIEGLFSFKKDKEKGTFIPKKKEVDIEAAMERLKRKQLLAQL
jgi:hypothetical protein